MRTFKGIVLLMVLWLAGGWLWYTYVRESVPPTPMTIPVRNAPVKDVNWTFESEQHWLVDEIGRDIAEITLYAKDAKTPVRDALEFNTKTSADSAKDFTFTAKTSSDSPSKHITLQRHLWAPENYSPWAQTLLDSWKITRPAQSTPPNSGLLKSLVSPRPQTLMQESQRISSELSQQPLNAELHEEAALVLGAFGLQEAAGQFADTRRTLCRMSAHLALARILQEKEGACGQVAEVIQLCLVNRQTEALEKITGFSSELSAWANALKIRSTDDWRILSKPEAASLLEKIEHGRALANSVGITPMLNFLQQAELPQMPVWNRIALEHRLSVQEGHLFAKPSLTVELQSLAEDWKTWSNKELQEGNLIQLINDPATRGVINTGNAGQQLEVLSWGDIASFHQRHICQSIQRTAYFLRSMWGVPDMADQFEQTVNAKLSGLRLYPFVLKHGAQNKDQYVQAMQGSLELCRKQPELITSSNWCSLLAKNNFGNPGSQVTAPLHWFTPVLPLGTAYDFYTRYYELHELYKADIAFWDNLLALAPYNFDVIRAQRYKHLGDKLTAKQVQDSFAKIIDYHLIAMKETADLVKNDPKVYEKYMRKACELDPDLYLDLGDYFLEHNQTEDAVFAYQAAFELAPDRVSVANASDWIVNYYFDHNRKADALKIATDAAEVYSYNGLLTMAKLMERMENYGEAEKHYAAIAERYKDSGPLVGFYNSYQEKNPSFAASLKKLTDETFPDGMEKVQMSDFTKAPTDGVSIDSINTHTNLAKLKRGDVLVALDGWRVRTMEQYLWVRDLKKDIPLNLIIWKGDKYVEVSVSVPNRRFRNNISTYQGR